MDFALRYVRFYPGVNSRAELVTLAPGLRPERRLAPLARESNFRCFLNFEVVGGIGLRTGLLIGQLTIVVRIAHFIIRFRNVFRCFTVVIL